MMSRHGGPTVSAVIANYNYGEFVVDAVQSALDQTYGTIEVIVVDDASTDDSVQRLQDAFGTSICLLRLDQNCGQVRAIEHAVTEASGDIICLLDADDRWHPDKVRRVVEVFESRPEVVQVSHGLRSIDQRGDAVGSGHRSPFAKPFARRMPLNSGDVRTQLFRWNRYGCAVTSGLAYRRETMDAMMPMPACFEGRSTYFDTWSTVAAAFLGQVDRVAEPLMEYRIHGANAAGGSTDFDRFADCWRTTGRLVDHWAARAGDDRRSDVETKDNRLALFRYLAGEPVSRRQRLRAVLATPIEATDIGATPLEAALQTAERVVKATSRRHGAAVKRLGLFRWLRLLVSRTPHQGAA